MTEMFYIGACPRIYMLGISNENLGSNPLIYVSNFILGILQLDRLF